jgi:sterol 14-demethylase
MMSALCSQTYKDGRPPSDREVAHMLTALLMAGQHTSSTSTAWTIMHLAHDSGVSSVHFLQHARPGSGHSRYVISGRLCIRNKLNTSQIQMELCDL